MTTVTVGSGETYTTYQAAEDFYDGAAADDYVFQGTDAANLGALVVGGWTSGSTLVITYNTGDYHNGSLSSGAYIETASASPSVQIVNPGIQVTLSGVRIKNTSSGSVVRVLSAGANTTSIIDCIINLARTSNTTAYCVYIDPDDNTTAKVYMENNLLVRTESTGGTGVYSEVLVFSAVTTGVELTAYNNTIVDLQVGFSFLRQQVIDGTANTTVVLRNNAAYTSNNSYQTTSVGTGTYSTTNTNNASSDGTASTWASGSDNVTSITTAVFNDYANDDFSLASGTNVLVDAGYNLAGIVDTDIIGTSRPQGSAYDIGAWERIAGGGSTYTATAALETGGASFSGSATFTAPTYTGSASPTVGGTEFAASASFTAPTFTASATPVIGGVEFSASAASTGPTYTASATLAIAGAEFTSTATFTVPVYSGNAALSIAGAEFAASATFIAPVFSAAASLAVAGVEFAAAALFDAGVFSATAAMTTGGTEFVANAEFDAPVYTATADPTIGGIEFAADASNTAPVFTAEAVITLGGMEFDADASVVNPTYAATADLSIAGAVFVATGTFSPPEFTATAVLEIGGVEFSGVANYSPSACPNRLEATQLQQITEALVEGLRTNLCMNTATCYPAIESAYIDGQAQTVLQVVLGEERTEEAGSGGQEGGDLQRRVSFDLTLWRRGKLDRHKRSDMLIEEVRRGLLDYTESVRSALALTVLGGLLLEPIRWENSGEITWHDQAKGVAFRVLTISVTWREKLPTTITMTDADCTTSFVNNNTDDGCNREEQTTPLEIVGRLAAGLRSTLCFNEATCYSILEPTYTDAQPATVLQIVPNPTGTEEAGYGGQEGGDLQRRLSVNLVVWRRMKLDRHLRSDQILVREAQGMIDLIESVRSILALTTLGGCTLEPVRWDGSGKTSWHNAPDGKDRGVVFRVLRVSATWREALPTTITM